MEEVEIFEKLVDQLDKLVPSQKSVRPIYKPDTGRIDAFAQGMALTKLNGDCYLTDTRN